MLSVVIPIHNEEPSILPLYDRLTAVMEGLRKPYEILFVDDASTDRSFDLLANLVETDHRLKVIRLRRNFGQTAALSAGFDEAQGSVVISLDGDLQHIVTAGDRYHGALGLGMLGNVPQRLLDHAIDAQGHPRRNCPGQGTRYQPNLNLP